MCLVAFQHWTGRWCCTTTFDRLLQHYQQPKAKFLLRDSYICLWRRGSLNSRGLSELTDCWEVDPCLWIDALTWNGRTTAWKWPEMVSSTTFLNVLGCKTCTVVPKSIWILCVNIITTKYQTNMTYILYIGVSWTFEPFF